MCIECLSSNNRATPLLNSIKCLTNHTQYICGACGRCICIEHNDKGLQRWNFPFKSLDIAKLYLRTADYTMKKPCGIYEIENSNGKLSYKILIDDFDLFRFLKNNPNKKCKKMVPIYKNEAFIEFSNTSVRKLYLYEVSKYINEQ